MRHRRSSRSSDTGILARLSYAAIGFALGAVLFGLVWLMVNFGDSPRHGGNLSLPFSPVGWSLAGGALFGVVGFVARDRVGSALGDLIAGLFEALMPSEEQHLPSWFVVLVLVAVAFGVYWFLARGSAG